MKSELVLAKHLARKAIVYIRQSTTHQVVNNQESLRLQYALQQRARELGWHEADIEVIDADLGMSGASTVMRVGFKELVGRVGLSEIGLILSIDVTRLARNCSDWYPLLDICGLRNCLIADRDGVYDPASPNGRLLLGLKGTISELELHTIRARLTSGLLAKAERGELALSLPVGLVRDPSGCVLKEPNIEVQERLDFLFESFLKLRTVAKVMRLFNSRDIDLPRRDRCGDVRWVRATVAAVASILKNPAYAGAFVYGRTRMRDAKREGAAGMKMPLAMGEWRIVVKGTYPAYIDWATYEKIRSIIKDNRAEYMKNKTRGAPRDGELLLHGIAWCARCGYKMYVRYKGGGEYVCNHLRTHNGLPICQHVRAKRVDEAVAQAFLTALAPAEIDALSRARRAKQQTDKALLTSAERQLERKRYEAALAERQYRRVDPDNRLVAGELERRWEVALNEARAAEDALKEQTASPARDPQHFGKSINEKVVSLAGRLPGIWSAASDQERKALVRCLIEKVVLDRGEHDITKARVVWRGSAVTELQVKMRVARQAALTHSDEMRDRALELARAKLNDGEIATVLTNEGYRSPANEEKVLLNTVSRLRRHAGVSPVKCSPRWRHSPELLSTNELAARLEIPVNWLYVQIRKGRIQIEPQPNGAYLFENKPETIDRIGKLRNHTLENVDLRICQPYERGHSHG